MICSNRKQARLELPAGPNTDFFDAGGHSLTALRLAALIERSTGRDVALRDLLSFPTPRALADRLAVSEVVEYEHAHLVPMAAPPPSDHADRTSLNAPVFCVHGAGGNVVHFTDIADVIGRRRPFIALQARGADGRGEPHATLDEMADAYAAEIEQVHAAPAPLVLAGYSAGGLVAWEIARRLVDRGHAVAGVLLLDTYHPTVRPRSRGIAELTREAASMGLAEAGGKVWRRLRNTAAEVSYRRQRRNGEVEVQGEARHQQMMEAIGGAFRAHTVQPCPVPVVLLSTTDQSSAFAHVPVDRGWTGETPDLRVIPVPGEHHDLLVGEVGRQTASTIDALAAELVDAMSGVG